jgi:hypothetical protein
VLVVSAAPHPPPTTPSIIIIAIATLFIKRIFYNLLEKPWTSRGAKENLPAALNRGFHRDKGAPRVGPESYLICENSGTCVLAELVRPLSEAHDAAVQVVTIKMSKLIVELGFHGENIFGNVFVDKLT